MKFHSSSDQFQDRERILVYGYSGSGKTNAWLSIAQWCQQEGLDAEFWVLDTDGGSVGRLIRRSYRDLHNVHWTEVYGWEDYNSALDHIQENAKEGDWLVIDMIDAAWDSVQEYFSQQVFQEDLADYFLEARKTLSDKDKSLDALEGWKDWVVIKKLYKRWLDKALFAGPYHIFAAAKAQTVEKNDPATIRAAFWNGSRPAGEKNLAHLFHSVLYLEHRMDKGKDTWTLTTMKDRGSRYVDSLKVQNFAMQYLVGIAGWGSEEE